MAESDGAWGAMVEHDSEMAEKWDSFDRLPDPGDNDILDGFVRSKNLDISALVRLGAKLTNEQTLAFGGPTWIKYRNMVSGERWSYTGSTFPQLKLVRHGVAPARTVLVVEGETDAARCTMLYACDVASLPAGARHFPDAYAEQLAGYAQVLVGLDPDEAGQAGAAKIEAALPHAVRFAAGSGDWCEVTEAPPLPVPPVSAGGIVFEDLTELLRNGVPDPLVLVDDMVYAEGVHLLSGHPGCGKTTLAMHLARSAMEAKVHVVWLDYEGGVKPSVRRLDACGVPAELVAERFHYAGWPTKAEEYLADVAALWPGALVVIDSFSKVLAQAGLSENDNSEVTSYTVKVVQGCKQNNLPVIIIDHIAKGAKDSEYSRGAGAKLADADVHWRVEKTAEFSRTQAGSIAVIQKKDREGFFPFASWWAFGDGLGKLTMSPLEGPPGEGDPTNDPSI